MPYREIFARVAAVGYLLTLSCRPTPHDEGVAQVLPDLQDASDYQLDAATNETSRPGNLDVDSDPLSEDDRSIVACADAADLVHGACPRGDVFLKPQSQSCSESGVYAQALQNPIFDESNRYSTEHINQYGVWAPPEVAPESWDRAELPVGACVYRLFGLPYECLPAVDDLFVGACSRTLPAASVSDFRLQNPNLEPGCVRPVWAAEGGGTWWYYRAGDGYTDVVICAPLCAAHYQHGACVGWQ